MKDAALVVLGAVLAAVFARTWGHRRLLQHVHEQLQVLQAIPDHWSSQRRELEKLADRDVARYIRYRNPSFPLHRLMSRWMDVGFIGVLLLLIPQATFIPGSETVKGWIAAAGAAAAAVAAIANLVILLTRRTAINAELENSATEKS